MKIKSIGFIVIVVLLLIACEGLPSTSKTSGLDLEEIQPIPTSESLPDDVTFREEMDEDITANWGVKVIYGLEEQLLLSQESGRVRIESLPNPNDVNFVFLNKDKNYKDVVVQMEVEYLESSDSFVGVICRASEEGWYEFRINNQCYYEVLKYDQYLKDQGKDAYENLVGVQLRSPIINSGKNKNIISLSCVGDQLKAFVNGEQVFKDRLPLVLEDDDFKEGTIGFSVAAFGSSTDISINWLETLKP